MAKGKKTGGRKKGSVNKNTLPLIERAQATGIDPFNVLLSFVAGDWKALGYDSPTKLVVIKGAAIEVDLITPEMRLRAAIEACGYIYPKRRPVDHEGKVEETKQVKEVVYVTEWGGTFETTDGNARSSDAN